MDYDYYGFKPYVSVAARRGSGCARTNEAPEEGPQDITRGNRRPEAPSTRLSSSCRDASRRASSRVSARKTGLFPSPKDIL
jgi:hypothetical protein